MNGWIGKWEIQNIDKLIHWWIETISPLFLSLSSVARLIHATSGLIRMARSRTSVASVSTSTKARSGFDGESWFGHFLDLSLQFVFLLICHFHFGLKPQDGQNALWWSQRNSLKLLYMEITTKLICLYSLGCSPQVQGVQRPQVCLPLCNIL